MDWDISRFEKSWRITKVVTFGSLILALITADFQQVFTRSQMFSVAGYWVLMVICVNAGRLVVIEIQKKFNILEYSPRKTLIIGCNEIAEKVLKDIQYNPHLIFEVIGFVAKKAQSKKFNDFPVLGNYTALPKLIHKYRVEEIIIALPEDATNDFIRILSLCEPQEVKIKIPPGIHEIFSSKRQSLMSHGYVQIFSENMVLWQWILKRFLDILVSLLAIILLSPFFLLSALLLLVRFRKTIFVRIPILGKYGIPFNMYVFRLTEADYNYRRNSLYIGTGELPKNSGRYVRFLYRFRLYKLPQLFNILFGDMSVVGPRPEPVEWYQENSDKIRFLHRRISVRPGITGLAQVKYHFEISQKVLQEWIKYDIYYIENMALRIDLGIFARTPLLMLLKPYNHSNGNR
jgi:lipopolysaccharide/colanic/teichoic acid biosynthesis glycosyltransferase